MSESREPKRPVGDGLGEPEEGASVDEPSGAQGTGGTGVPASDEPGAAMPKPTEDPGRVRRAARPAAEPGPSPEPGQAADGPAAPGGVAPQAPVGWLSRGAEEIFGPEATAAHAYELLTVDVPAERWIAALETARDELGCTYFDWLSAVDEPGTGFRICAHVAALPGEPGESVRRLLLRTTVPHETPVLPTATGVFAGAGWHERETHEMFGVDFTGHPHLMPLLLPDGFEGHPLRKDFVLAARVAKAWPGAKEPGESGHGGPKRRQMLPPGVPDPNEWGPLKGQLPPAPSRPARGRAAAAGDRPARRTRSASAGSASQRPAGTDPGSAADTDTTADTAAEPRRPSRRARTAGEGSASQREVRVDAPAADDASASPRGGRDGVSGTGDASPTRRDASAGGTPPAGEAPAAPRPPRRARSASEGSASQREGASGAGQAPRGTPGSADAPWHHARPAFEDDGADDGSAADDAPRAARDDDTPGENATFRDDAAAGGESRDDDTGGGR